MTNDQQTLDLMRFEVEGQSYYVDRDIGEKFRQMLSSASEICEQIHGLVTPVYLVGIGQKVIAAIKSLRQYTGLNLKNAKYEVDKVRDGQKVKIGDFPYNTALQIRAEFAEQGHTVQIASPLELLARAAE